MNLLTMLFDQFWGKPGNVASLRYYQGVLKRPNVSKDMKNFHACDTFFRHVVDAHIVALLMETTGHKDIDKFKAWVARSDWPHLIEKVQELYLRPSYIQFLWAKGKREHKLAIDIALMGRKEEWIAALEEQDTPEPEPNWDDIRKEIEADIDMKSRDVVRENSLIITILGLLYCDFADACRTGYSGRIEQCIGCFAVIFQATKSTKYARKMIHMVACFKKLWKKEMKEAWLHSCLINISGRPNKFVPDDWFGETIIMLNKENINPSANAKSDEFLRETVSRNVLSLWNSKAVLSQAARSTSHGNRHSTISSFPDICYLIKILANESAFEEQLG